MNQTSTITRFSIDIPEADLLDLQARLTRTRFPAPLPGDGWDTGVPVGYLRDLVEYWRDGYDWWAAEKAINGLMGGVRRSARGDVRPGAGCVRRLGQPILGGSVGFARLARQFPAVTVAGSSAPVAAP